LVNNKYEPNRLNQRRGRLARLRDESWLIVDRSFLAVPHPFSAFPRDRGVFNAGDLGDVGVVGVAIDEA